MAVNVYDELSGHALRIQALEARVAKLEAAAAPKTRVAPVSYFRPDKLGPDGKLLWDAVLAQKPALALINPGSGPGASPSTSYATLVARVQSAGLPVYGYVHTQYGTRPPADVKADILNHRAWYGVSGIFVDTTANTLDRLPYYTDLCSYIHGLGLKVCLNPGTQTIEEHAQIADYVMVSEGDVPTYRTRVARAWEAKYPGKLWHCVHSCTAADMPSIVALAKSRQAGLLYVTDDVMANPYDTLASYWPALCAEVARAS